MFKDIFMGIENKIHKIKRLKDIDKSYFCPSWVCFHCNIQQGCRTLHKDLNQGSRF